MKLVFYSVILNNHQANVADELWELTGHQYCFVELENLSGESRKGDTRNYEDCPYLLRAWESKEAYNKAMELARTAECCVFSGVLALPFQRERMKLGLFSFDMSERWLKKGFINLFSLAIFRMMFAYYWGSWYKKPLYKLCCSAFAARDQQIVGTYRNRCYKWGYFTKVNKIDVEVFTDFSTSNIAQLMWCSRYLMWKHPELPILMAERLKKKGYRFLLDMYGDGEYKPKAMQLAQELGVTDVIRFCGNKPNDELMIDMRQHSIFLFTSDKNEGWGAVANECMSNGCVLVASEAIGSVPYLLKERETGLTFTAPKTTSSFDKYDKAALDSLCDKVEWLLNNPEKRKEMQKEAFKQMQQLWEPYVASKRLLVLIDCLKSNSQIPFSDGPCSKA